MSREGVTNWAAYNESLRQRGDLTVWINSDAHKLWTAPRRISRGGQPKYSDLAITICLTLSVIYKQPLRQIQGLMRGIVRLMGLDISVPDFSTLSRRGRDLSLPARPGTRRTEPICLVVDSTGLKIFGEGEWLQNKHKPKAKRKSWRKLHLGLDLVTGEIIIPPPKNAIPSLQSKHDPTLRDRHIAAIRNHGRLAWQSSAGYNQRSRAEAQMGRWKGVIGPKLKARSLENQKTEVRIAVEVLNKMTELGRSEFEVIS